MTNYHSLWQFNIKNIPHNAEIFEVAFSDDSISYSFFQNADEKSISLQFIMQEKPDEQTLREVMRQLCVVAGLEEVEYELAKLNDTDWIAETIKSFPPIYAGDFFVYGSHHKGHVPRGKIPLLMDAGTAFGSGEHATTAACLEALTHLSKKYKYRKVLDVGTGSGILSIAARKKHRKAHITSVDIDDTAVKFAREYSAKNGIRGKAQFAVSNGHKSRAAKKNAPYNLIFANILARPLMKMAKDLSLHIDKNGHAILSGLLDRHERMALYPHRMKGLVLKKRIRKNGWLALIIG